MQMQMQLMVTCFTLEASDVSVARDPLWVKSKCKRHEIWGRKERPLPPMTTILTSLFFLALA